MIDKKITLFTFVLSMTPLAFSADYPAELHGKWGTSPDYCPSLEIDKKYSVQGSELTCQAVSIKANGNTFVVKEKCNGVAGSFTQNTPYLISGDALTVTFGPSVVKHQRCGSASSASAPPTTQEASSVLTCKVIEEAAGVTTFLDAKLKKQGNIIRSFDGYTFKADKKIKVDKTDVLVGKLIRDDGSVSEAKSYAYAGEWNCK